MARSFMRNFVLAAALSLVPFQASFWSTTPAVAQEATLTDPASGDSASKKTRVFKFTYGAVLTKLQPGKSVKVWLPVATGNHDQDVEFLDINQENFERTSEKKYGNALIYFQATANDAGEVPIEVNYLVTRRELTSKSLEPAGDGAKSFLGSSTLVPTSDQLRKIVMDSASPSKSSDAASAIQVARQLYDGVDNHMKYNKPADIKGWGKGDAVWALSLIHI